MNTRARQDARWPNAWRNTRTQLRAERRKLHPWNRARDATDWPSPEALALLRRIHRNSWLEGVREPSWRWHWVTAASAPAPREFPAPSIPDECGGLSAASSP